MKLNIRSCRNLDSLLEALNKFTEKIEKFRTKEENARQVENKKPKQAENKYSEKVVLGAFDNFFFHLVLDNVKALFKIER